MTTKFDSILRALLAIAAGTLAMFVVITAVEAANAFAFFPAPAGMDWRDPAQVTAFAATLPATAMALVLGGWCLGAFVGGAVGGLVGGRSWPLCALVIGGIVVAGVLDSASRIHHPGWVLSLGLGLPVPLALLAARTFRRVSPAPGK
ncbi:MAG: hypothetical protein ABI588_02920 [Arenimonas sp.]